MKTNWFRVKHFRASEWKQDPEMVNADLVYLVDELRDYVGKPFVVHEAWATTGHAQDGTHGLGLAVDGHFVGLSLIDQWIAAERFPFTGIGIYPYWNNPGLHLDIRSVPRKAGNRWWRDANGVYKSLDKQFLIKLIAMPDVRQV